MNSNLNSVGGSSVATQTSNQPTTAEDLVDQEFTGTENTVGAVKYPTIGNYYFGHGALSFDMNGRLIFGNAENEPNPGALRLDMNKSTAYSTATNTTLGSIKIDTVDGKVMNPLSNWMPSSFFTPVKTWMSSLMPLGHMRDMAIVSMLGLMSKYLLNKRKTTSYTYRTSYSEQNSSNISVAQMVRDQFQNFLSR